jgi:glycine cleavage system pyridoxal-binding protein P
MSELGDKRKLFTWCLMQLLVKMFADGYAPMHGKDGLKHMKNSLHYEGLAVDIDLTQDGVYLSKTEDHQVFGEFWETLSHDC